MIPLQDVCWLLSPQTLGSCSWSNRASSTSSTSQDHSGDWSCYSERVRKWGEKYLKVEKLNVWGRLQGFHRPYLVVVEIQNLWEKLHLKSKWNRVYIPWCCSTWWGLRSWWFPGSGNGGGRAGAARWNSPRPGTVATIVLTNEKSQVRYNVNVISERC